MTEFVTAYVKGCAICQSTKSGTTKVKQPLFLINTKSGATPFMTIALDLIIDLPKSAGYNSIITITDHNVSKASLFLPCNQTIGVIGAAQLYTQHIFPHFSIPQKVIFDRDTCFMAQFTKELCHLLDITQNISTTYHPQTDGQSEQTNQWLEQYLRVYCNFQQDDWSQLLPMVQYVHNSWPSSTTGFTPFELLMGFTPRLKVPTTVESPLPEIEQRGEHLKQIQERAQEAIGKAQRMVILQSKKRRKGHFKGYQVGEKVWLEGTNLHLSHPTAKLAPKRYGPFQVTKVISPVVYQIKLPANWKIFNTFHVSLLSPYQETIEHGANYPEPPPDLVNDQEEYEVEEILASRCYGRWKKLQYLVKWVRYSPAHNSWEPAENVNTPELVTEFHQQHASTARQVLQKPAEQGEPERMPVHTPPTSFLPFIFPHQGHTFSPATFNKQNCFNGIHKALDGTSPRCQIWYNDSSPYTSQANRRQVAEDDHTSHAQNHCSQTPHTHTNAPNDVPPHLDTMTQAEWARAMDVALNQPEESVYSHSTMSSQ
jgi:hypothetical protein